MSQIAACLPTTGSEPVLAVLGALLLALGTTAAFVARRARTSYRATMIVGALVVASTLAWQAGPADAAGPCGSGTSGAPLPVSADALSDA